MIKIIEANITDITHIQAIAREAWPATFKDILSPEQIDYMMQMMYSSDALVEQLSKLNHRFLLAQEEGCYVGYISFETNYRQQHKTKIHKIYLLPGTQGKGIGRKLFEEVSALALQHADHILSLNVNRENKAINFYKKIGFTVIGQENIAIGKGFLMEDYIMEHVLGS